MPHSSEINKREYKNSNDSNVIQLGFNISVAGESASDFEIYVNDKKQGCGQLSATNLKQISSSSDQAVQGVGSNYESERDKFAGGSSNDKNSVTEDVSLDLSHLKKSERTCASMESVDRMSRTEDLTIVDEIKSAMGNFEKFSEHVREIPRLSTRRIYSSTPYPDKKNSRSEGNLSLYGNTSRSYIPKHDFRDRKYFRRPKALSSDVFLKPLPAEDYFKKAFVRRYYDAESFYRYSSVDSLPQCFDYVCESKVFEKNAAKSDIDKSDALSSASDVCVPESKTSKRVEASEHNDKHSTSSESTRDIKIYQSGGVIIMQNFNENTDLIEKKDFSGGDKLIEQCNKLAEKVENSLHSSDESQRLLLNSSSDETKGQAGKFVQFDLTSSENTRSKSGDSLSEVPKNDSVQTSNNESYTIKADVSKIKGNPLAVPQNQDFTSLSTQENDSLFSNLPGMSPTSSTSGKKLEWDSGADVGYLNLDLTTENISTIERIILKGLSADGVTNKQVVYKKTAQDSATRPSKCILERMPSSELDIEGINQNSSNKGNGYSNEGIRASKPSIASTESSQSDKGVALASMKRQTVKNEEKPQISSDEKNNKRKHHSKNSKSVDNCRPRRTSKSDLKLFEQSEEPVKILPGPATSSTEEKLVDIKDTEKSEEVVAFSDKSTYVNTLYSDLCLDLQLDSISVSGESCRSDSSEKCRPDHGDSARTKKYTKKRNNAQETNLTGRLKDKINKIIDIARQSNRPYAKDKFSNNFEPRPKMNVFHYQCANAAGLKVTKSDPPSLSSLRKSASSNAKEKLVRSRPISASSSSVRTVKSNVNAPKDDTPKEKTDSLSDEKKFADQIIQTTELLYESKSVQAFQSAKCSTVSSAVEDIGERNMDEVSGDISGIRELKDDENTNLMLSCSKSIQAPGMNSSLPKHLAHPKQMDLVDQVNTKSTQFFGGPVTSLPNYRSNTTAKEVDKLKISKSKFSSDENSRIMQKNAKNASLKKSIEREAMRESTLNRESKSVTEDICDYKQKKSDKKKEKNRNDPENKENFSVNEEELTNYSKKTEELSERGSKESHNLVTGSKKSDSVNFGSCDVQLSDDGNNIFLTSDLLKEHGNSIDRNIIQEKYFQSQLLELGRRPMISRSTSMEKKRELERDTQTGFSLKTSASVGCQYSPNTVSKSDDLMHHREPETESGREEMRPENGSGAEESIAKCSAEKENKYQTLGSSVEDKDFALGDSLSSQSAHSWVPGEEPSSENQNFPVDRTHSFEYLPGHIYENPENMSGKSSPTRKQSVLLVNSVESESDSVPESNAEVKNSGSGHTLVFENTDMTPPGSDQMKNLDINITELDMVVNRLHEKEALFQRITDSVLNTVSKTNGSGDSTHPSGGESLSNNNSQATEHITYEIDLEEESSKSNESKPKVIVKSVDGKEISTACQTDAYNYFFEEKKKLEQKMNDEKAQQIKWIENEIHHLNMLRSLLEKQEDLKNSVQRKKRNHYLTEAKEGVSTETLNQGILRDLLRDSLYKTESSMRDSTVEDNLKLMTSAPLKSTEDSAESVKQLSDTAKSYAQFGMALSLSRANNVQEITMLPVGVQVTLRNRKTGERRGSSLEKQSDLDLEDKTRQNSRVASLEAVGQNDVGVQHPSPNNRLSGSNLSVDSSDSRRCRCFKCNKSKCICLKSDSMDKKKSFQGSLQSDKRYEEYSTKPVGGSTTVTSGEFSKSDVKIPEIRDIDNSRGASTIGTSTPQVSRSRESSKQDRYYTISERSVPFEKCTCLCHAKPLPRCGSCNLLNTCKKCQCYKRIQCCVCKITASRGSLQRAGTTVSSSCLCNNDFCHMCQCSRVKNQICSLCPCHAKLSLETVCKCSKTYEERSCQTEGKECKCCKCNEKQKEERGIYRETKYMVEEQHVTENREPSEMVFPSESKYETEGRKSMEEKFPFQMKVPLEKKNHAESKDAMQMKSELEKRCACQIQPVGIKELKGKIQCRCHSRNANRKINEEHPRHYFLQVEETTEEESSESGDNRNSLEVITIKVPIRKVCKANRNSNSSPQRNLRKPIAKKERGDVIGSESRCLDQSPEVPNECKCCEDCIGHSHKCVVERSRTADDICRGHRTQYGDSKRPQRIQEPLSCKCCEDCPGRQNLKVEEKKSFEYATCDDYERQKFNAISYKKPQKNVMEENPCDCENCIAQNNFQFLKYPASEYGYAEETTMPGECQCCNDCPGRTNEDLKSQKPKPNYPDAEEEEEEEEEEESERPSEVPVFSTKTEKRRSIHAVEENGYKSHNRRTADERYNKESSQNFGRKSPLSKTCHSPRGTKSSKSKASQEKDKDKNKSSDYYNFNKREYLTKSELEREEKKKKPTRLTLQECLTVKRPDLYTRAECRRKIISEKSRDRAERRDKRIECLSKCFPQCDNPKTDADMKLFTSAQMRKQTKKFYRKLPEVTNKVAEEKKKMQFQTNKLMAEIFAKKLQLHTLKGCLNLSNSFSVLSTM